MGAELNVDDAVRIATMRAMSKVATARGFRLQDAREELADAALAAAPLIVAAELEQVGEWCEALAGVLSHYGTPTAASNAVWDVIDEIRRRLSELRGEASHG